MSPKVWKEIEISNQTIQIISVVPDRIQEAASVMHKAFFPAETICLGCAMVSNPAACNELEHLSAKIAEDGFSLIAVVKETNEIIGVCFNKLQKLGDPSEPGFFEKFRDEHCKEKNSSTLISFMMDLDACVNLFETLGVTSLLEITFLAVVPEWGGRGIGRLLTESSLELIKSLQFENAPKYATTLATSKYSYKIFQNLGFRFVFKKEFSDYHFDNKWKFSDKVDCNLHDQGLVLMVKEA